MHISHVVPSYTVPIPNVSVTVLNQSIGNTLLLRCDVNTVRGITSKVDIMWKVNNREIERYNGNILENVISYVYYYNTSKKLTVNDNNAIYQCQVFVNRSPSINATDSLTLNLTIGENHKFLLKPLIHMYFLYLFLST